MNNNNNNTLEKETQVKIKKEKTIKNEETKKVEKTKIIVKGKIEVLSISTLNVQGMNVPLKRQLIFEYLNKEDIDIVSVTETKLAQKEDLRRSLLNQYYYVYTAATPEDLGLKRESAMGTALLIKPYLRHYIHNIESYLGTAIMIDFFLPGNLRTRIISLYLPSDKIEISLKTQDKTKKWISDANKRNMKIIVMGDFNNNMARADSKRKTPIFKTMSMNRMLSLLEVNKIQDYTWKRDQMESQIDDIWISEEIVVDTSYPIIEEVEPSGSDHRMIKVQWKLKRKFEAIRRKKRSRKVFKYNEMDEDKWEDFRAEIKRKIEALEIKKITDETSLNKAWHKLYIAIKHSAEKHIKWLKIHNNYFGARTKKASELHQGLVKINKLIRNLKEVKSHFPLSYEEVTKRLNKKIVSITTKLGIEIINIKEQDLWSENIKQLVKNMIELRKSIHVTRQIENNSEIREEISLAVERRQNNFQTNTKRMIDSILKRKRNRVTFDNIIKADEVITDEKGIKEEVVKHFKNWTKRNPTDEEHWKLWEKEYDPVPSIAQEDYEGLIATIEFEELENLISEAPNGKATGESGISNEMIKKLPLEAKKIFLEICNFCLAKETVPIAWRQGVVYPIPKKKDFEGDLTQTRPITLIEHSRKIFTKMLTKRLNKILGQKKVLNIRNNSALPNTSTTGPIQWLTNIQEYAWLKEKDYWLVSQDMSKAYDSVHLPLLWKALRRINIPEKFINLTKNLMEKRKNKVLTNLGQTKAYEVEDGLDQGGTMSPLLWRIYYDPLIAKIDRDFEGFSMSVKTPTGNEYKTSLSVMAYMDDSLWIAESKSQLEEILKTASSFYKMTGIKVNASKSIFLTNTRGDTSVFFENQILERRQQDEPFRYLGCWFKEKKNQDKINKKIKEEAEEAIDRLNKSRITEKQYIYIVNSVILTRIAYRCQNTYIKESMCEIIDKKIMKGVKQKARIVRTAPNTLLWHYNIYGLNKTKDIQRLQHVNQLWKDMNNTNWNETPAFIIIQELQNAANTNTSILEEEPVFPKEVNASRTAAIIKEMHETEIKLVNERKVWPQPLKEKGTSINYILKKMEKRNDIKTSINKHGLKYIEQLLDGECKNFVTWKGLAHNLGKIIKGKKPRWFEAICTLITNNENPSLKLIVPNPFTIRCITNESWKENKWVTNSVGLIGKVRKIEENLATLRHWYRKENQITRACNGCDEHIPTRTNAGIMKIHTRFLSGIIANGKKEIYSNIQDITRTFRIKKEETSIIPREPFIGKKLLTSWNLKKIFTNIEDELWKKIENFGLGKEEEYEIVEGKKSEDKTEGIAILIQMKSMQETIELKVESWPTKLKTALTGIALALVLSKDKEEVKIKTNIKGLKEEVERKVIRAEENFKLKENLDQFTEIIRRIMKMKRSRITIVYEEKISRNKATRKWITDIVGEKIATNMYLIKFEGKPVYWNLRRFMKQLIKGKIISEWSSQNRIENLKKKTEIDWKTTYNGLNIESRPLARYTSTKASIIKSFKVKMMINELPTLLNMYYRDTKKEKDPMCPRCEKEYENQTHWIWCQENIYSMKQAITEVYEESKEAKKVPEKTREEETKKYIEWLKKTEVPPCIIPKENIIPGSKNEKRNHKKDFTNLLMEKIYEKIWIPSREAINNSEERKDRNVIKNNIPTEPIHGKETSGNALRKYAKWKKLFIDNNEKVDTIEDFD